VRGYSRSAFPNHSKGPAPRVLGAERRAHAEQRPRCVGDGRIGFYLVQKQEEEETTGRSHASQRYDLGGTLEIPFCRLFFPEHLHFRSKERGRTLPTQVPHPRHAHASCFDDTPPLIYLIWMPTWDSITFLHACRTQTPSSPRHHRHEAHEGLYVTLSSSIRDTKLYPPPPYWRV